MKPLFLAFLFTPLLALSAQAESKFVPEGTCQLTVSTHSTKSRASAAAKQITYRNRGNIEIYETNKKKFVVSIGNIRHSDVPPTLKELILGGDAPNADCVLGHDFVAVYNMNGYPRPEKKSAPKECYFVVGSRKNSFEAAQFIDTLTSIDEGDFEIFLAKNGWYAVTLGLIKENLFEFQKSIQSVPDDSFCTSGKGWTRVPHVCNRQAFTCSEGYQVKYDSCAAQFAVGWIGVSADKAFCALPDTFPKETLTVNGFQGLNEATDTYSFSGFTNTEKFLIEVTPKDNFVNFKWKKPVQRSQTSTSKRATSTSSTRCVSITGEVTGSSVESIKLSKAGGPGDVDNSWSTPQICTGYGGIEGTYRYSISTGSKTCNGTFNLTSAARTGMTISLYDTCSVQFINGY